MPDLPSLPLPGGNVGYLPSSSSSGGASNAENDNAGNIGGLINAGIPALFSLFGPGNPYKDKTSATADQLHDQALTSGQQGKSLSADAMAALAPVLKYLKAISGGDPGALLGATEPARARVLDQYDTARRGAQFLPRGGGQSSAILNLNAKQASDTSTLLASTQASGVSELGSLGKDLLSTGVNETNSASQALSSALQGYEKLSGDKDQENHALGSEIGGLISTALPFVLPFL